MKYCFVFVCQHGELEVKATLLAASLKRHLRCDHELVAAIPGPEYVWGSPSRVTQDALRSLGVRTVCIENPIGPDYPIGNKIACLSVETDSEKVVFLDSDMLCLREFSGDARFEKWKASAKPADLATFGAEPARWQRVYTTCGLPPPKETVLSTVSGVSMPPYFNAGFVAIDREVPLGAEWAGCAGRIDADPTVPDKRPWLDQIALPVALARLGIVPDCVDERYNYPAHLKPVPMRHLPYFMHYHTPEVIRAEPLANALVAELAAEHEQLRGILEASPAWRVLLHPYQFASGIGADQQHGNDVVGPRDAPRPDGLLCPELIVTGIPRSGTSYLSGLVHGVEDCVVINEPASVFAPLAGPGLPWGIPIYYRDLRRDIRDSRPVANKLHEGRFIEDTARVDTVEHYLPRVSRSDFLLGTKNTLAFLARLPHLQLVMPEARIVACVRHPFDTIASWKSTFDHLRRADLESQVVGHSRDVVMTEWQRERLREIAATQSLATRRALAWRHLAEILLENKTTIELIRYEDMVASPSTVVRRILDATPNMFETGPLVIANQSAPRSRRDTLESEDFDAIQEICADAAGRLGYEFS